MHCVSQVEALLAVTPAKSVPFLFEHYARTIAEHGLAADSRASTGSEDTGNSSSPTQAIAQGKALDMIGSTSKQSGDQPKANERSYP